MCVPYKPLLKNDQLGLLVGANRKNRVGNVKKSSFDWSNRRIVTAYAIHKGLWHYIKRELKSDEMRLLASLVDFVQEGGENFAFETARLVSGGDLCLQFLCDLLLVFAIMRVDL